MTSILMSEQDKLDQELRDQDKLIEGTPTSQSFYLNIASGAVLPRANRTGGTHIRISEDFKTFRIIFDNSTFKMTDEKLEKIKKFTFSKLPQLAKISQEQTPDYLNRYALEGTYSSIKIKVGGLFLEIDVNACLHGLGLQHKLCSDFINKVKKFIME